MASSFLLCYLPSFVLLILPLIQSNVLDGVPPVSPLLNAVIRIIDPVIWILCVQEYRQSILLPMTSIVCEFENVRNSFQVEIQVVTLSLEATKNQIVDAFKLFELVLDLVIIL